VQHELMPRVSVSGGYFRRVQGNFFVTDNEALGPADYLPYSVTVPSSDSRLPTAGQTISGLYDQRATVVNRNVVKAASQFGNQFQHWNGIDLGVDARLKNGVFLQAGLSTGTTMTDNCDVTAKEDHRSLLYCHQEIGPLTQYKGLGSYTLPWGGVRLSATFQSLPGPQVAANHHYMHTALT